jgi:hypothetical protein
MVRISVRKSHIGNNVFVQCIPGHILVHRNATLQDLATKELHTDMLGQSLDHEIVNHVHRNGMSFNKQRGGSSYLQSGGCLFLSQQGGLG